MILQKVWGFGQHTVQGVSLNASGKYSRWILCCRKDIILSTAQDHSLKDTKHIHPLLISTPVPPPPSSSPPQITPNLRFARTSDHVDQRACNEQRHALFSDPSTDAASVSRLQHRPPSRPPPSAHFFECRILALPAP